MALEKTLYLLDGNALVYRAHFAFISRPLYNSKGFNTSAITGFVRSLWDILSNRNPSHIAVSFDVSSKTFRNEWYPEYKANREEQPDEITQAFPYIYQIVEGFNIPVVTMEGYEADDIIGTLAKQAANDGFTVYMVTPDKDFAQLVDDNIFLFKPSRQGNGVDILGKAEICKKWDIQEVTQVIDVLGLQGDSVDNIPGVPGVGAKTASKLLAAYHSIENLYEHTHELKGKLKERIEANKDQAFLSKKLATIDLQVPIQFDAKVFERSLMDQNKLKSIFHELEFRTLAEAILESEAPGTQGSLFGADESPKKKPAPRPSRIASKNIHNTDHSYQTLYDIQDIKAYCDTLMRQPEICVDTETNKLSAIESEILGISVSFEAHKAIYIPIPQNENARAAIFAALKPPLENASIAKIGQNIKYDINVFHKVGIDVKGKLLDTQIAHYLLEPQQKHGMDYLSETYLDYAPISITELIGKKGKRQLSLEQIDIDKVARYAAEDADVTYQLQKVLFPKLTEKGLDSLYDKTEGPLVRVLADMEREGVRISADYLNAYSIELGDEIASIERSIYEQAGVNFNIGSPRQVGEVLFDKMKIPYRWKKTASGQYATDEEKMTELSKNHSIVQDIMHFRMLSKLKSTYVDALPQLISDRTGRVHSSFNQALAATGRLSSNNPNLQNIPIRTPEGRRVREAFVPRDENHVLLAADYSQIELRLIAEIAQDEAMLEAFTKGQDIHRATAARVYEVPYEEVTSDQRRNAKTVNFSITYGAGALNLSRQLDIKRAEAKQLIEQYFKQYHGLKKYMDKTVAFARENGYVETLLGRKRDIREINSKSSMARSGAERIAINTPIQGTAADMIKVAMVDIHRSLKQQNLSTKMILQVHDELVFDVPKEELEIVKPMVEKLMKDALPNLQVPIVVGLGVGNNWLEAH